MIKVESDLFIAEARGIVTHIKSTDSRNTTMLSIATWDIEELVDVLESLREQLDGYDEDDEDWEA